MNLYITGFLIDDSEDSSLKYEFDIPPDLESDVMAVLGWESLEKECDGELPLTEEHVREISKIIQRQLPLDLDLFIGVVA
ncbi:pyocin S6 family toxin immunity protein [Pseudomonas sp. JDS28PS106]|uniref:pyocin S6 family toxin immunity protein n=1 Tax=Pseudomonas sp. JDS28PS106 TaxID=2497235 RepID=UPI002FCF1DC8